MMIMMIHIIMIIIIPNWETPVFVSPVQGRIQARASGAFSHLSVSSGALSHLSVSSGALSHLSLSSGALSHLSVSSGALFQLSISSGALFVDSYRGKYNLGPLNKDKKLPT